LPGSENDYGNGRQTEDLEDRWTLMIPRPPAEPVRNVSRAAWDASGSERHRRNRGPRGRVSGGLPATS